MMRLSAMLGRIPRLLLFAVAGLIQVALIAVMVALAILISAIAINTTTMAPPPPCLSICWISYFRQSHVPLRLMSMVRSQSSSDCSTMGIQAPSIPALLKATSTRPNFSTVF